MKVIEGITVFDDVNDAMMAIDDLTDIQRKYMLLDLMWKFVVPSSRNKLPHMGVIQVAYNNAKMRSCNDDTSNSKA